MSDIEFVLSLTPKQCLKFVEFINFNNFHVGILSSDNNTKYRLIVDETSEEGRFRGEYKWVENKWKETDIQRNNLKLVL